jgi:hypothetical protein
VVRAVSAFLLAAGLALATAACDSTAQLPVDPTPTPTVITENFAGDLGIGTIGVHQFTANKGVATATLTSLSPLSTAFLGMSLGTWDGTTCTVIAASDAANVGSRVVGTATIDNVAMCLRVYDIGNVPPEATYSYTVTVAHF